LARDTLLPIALVGGLLLLAGLGLPRLAIDGPRVYALPDDHPLPALSAQLNAATGGDDLLAVVVVDESGDEPGLLDADGVALLERIRLGMQGLAVFDRVRSVTTTALLADVEGAVSAIRPLVPPPTDEAGWRSAREAVFADPFARDLMISQDGRTALVAGWLFRGSAEEALLRRVTVALHDPDFRGGDAGAALNDLVNSARLAVVLGEAPGPVHAEVGRRLAALAEAGGPAGTLVDAWRQECLEDPTPRARAALETLLARLDPGAGVRIGVAGVAVVEAALTDEIPAAVRLALLGLVLLAGLVAALTRRSMRDGAVVVIGTTIAFVVSLGLFGLLGVPLHTSSALAALAGGAWTGGLLAARSSARLPAISAAILCAVLSAVAGAAGLAVAGASLAPVIALAGGSLIGLTLPVGEPRPEGTAQPVTWDQPRWWSTQLAALLLLVGLVGSLGRVAGVDAAGLLSVAHPAGRATVDLAEGLGVAPSAWAVYRNPGRDRALASPTALSGLRLAQTALEADEAVAGTRSWADFVSALHSRVSGAPEGALPDELALVEQYLLMFGQDDEVRTLVSEDLSLGVAFVRLVPGGGAHLGRLAELWPAEGDPVALAGQGVQVALATRLGARRLLWAAAGCLALVLVLVLIGTMGRGAGGRRTVTDLLSVSAVTLLALAASSEVLGSVSPACGLAVSTVLGTAGLATLLPRRQAAALLLVVGAGTALLIPSPALELRAFAVGLAAGCLGLLAIRLTAAEGPAPDLRS
jgi:hypothetical protein